MPLYKLLGGKVNEKLRYYRSGGLGEVRSRATATASGREQMAAEGIDRREVRSVRPLAGRDAWRPRSTDRSTPREVADAIALVRGIREGAPDLEICLDVHAKFNTGAAIRVAKALEPYDVMFFEEPILAEQASAMKAVQEATSTPIAAGERLKSRFQMYQYIEQDAIRLYQPDAARIGGITEFRKAVSLAETHFIPFQPHNPNGVVCLAAHLHLATSSANFSILEQGRLNPNDSDRRRAAARAVRRVASRSRRSSGAPERPGLGVTMSPAFIKEHSSTSARPSAADREWA